MRISSPGAVAMPASVLALLGLGLYLRSLRTVSAFALGSATLICGLLLFYSGTPDALPLLFLFLIFTRVAPVVAIAEVKHILKVAGSQFVGKNATTHDGHSTVQVNKEEN